MTESSHIDSPIIVGETVIVGEVTGVSGVKGWIKVFSHTEPRINIVKYNPWLLSQGSDWKPVKLINGRAQGKNHCCPN